MLGITTYCIIAINSHNLYQNVSTAKGKVKGKGKHIAVSNNIASPLSELTCQWDHTVLPATRQRWHSHLYPSRSWYSI